MIIVSSSKSSEEIAKELILSKLGSLVRDLEAEKVVHENSARISHTEGSKEFYGMLVSKCDEVISILHNINQDIDTIVKNNG